jgi:K+-sensing histidine kinase KdpD
LLNGSITLAAPVFLQQFDYLALDTGTGIDLEILPKLFTKFVTKSNSGTGLGLYICKGIIEAHNGRIWAENNSKQISRRNVDVLHNSLIILCT